MDKGATLVAEKKDVSNLFKAHSETGIGANLIWIVENGCSNHMFGLKDIFKDLDKSQKLKFH